MAQKSLFDYLSSVRLTIILLSLIAIASLAGIIIPQNLTAEQYKAKYGGIFSKIMMSLQLNRVYRSYLYSVLLVAFCVNLCVCSVRNAVPLIRSLTKTSAQASITDLTNMPNYRRITVSDKSLDEISKSIKDTLKRSLYKLKDVNDANCVYYFERGKIGRFGSLVTHASIIIITIGALIVGWTGFKEYRKIPEGDTIDVPNSDFQLRVKDFRIELYDNHTPKEYISEVTIIEDGMSKVTKTIEVNKPMKYKGLKFYQSDFGIISTIEVGLMKRKQDEAEVLGKYNIVEGQTFHVPESEFDIKVLAYVPMNLSNPAALLELYEGDQLIYRSWSFMNFPELESSPQAEYFLRLLSIGAARYYTELQISKDPGLSVIWLGALVMMLGLFLSLYVHHKRIWIRIAVINDETVVEVGGRSHKDRAGFDSEFNKIEGLNNGV